MNTATIDQFVNRLVDSGLMSAGDVKSWFAELPDSERPDDAQQLARILVRAGRLTKYQATAVYEGKTDHLVLGDYEIRDRIGAGGMGQVYGARHRRMKRDVALKLIAESITKNADALARFQREVEAAARLVHPNIVTAYDAGEDKGIHYLVMEYIDGGDLHSVVKQRGPLPVDHAVDCIVQAARGVAHAHSQGIIHRDIKPSNLLIDRTGAVKILDMGLARIEDQIEGSQSTVNLLTASGMIMGTVDYMAPEQAVNTRAADHRSDIYSLGCTLFHLLTGEQMYAGETAVEKLLAHREQPIPRLAELRDDIPESLAEVFEKMVAKKPDDRYQSMTEVVQSLESCLSTVGSGKSSAFNLSDLEDPDLASFLKGVATGGKAKTQPNTQSDGVPETVALERTQGFGILHPDRGAPETTSSVPAGSSPETIAPTQSGQEKESRPRSRRNPKMMLGLTIGGAAFMFLGLLSLMWLLVGGPSLFNPKANGVGDHETAEDVTNQVRRGGTPELQALADRVKKLNTDITSMPDPSRADVKKLRDDLLAYARSKPATDEAIAAMRLLYFVPAPADLLRREDIDPYELQVATRRAESTVQDDGSERITSSLPELVAILGDSRWKHWATGYVLAYSPDGRTIASGGSDFAIRLWDAVTGHQRLVVDVDSAVWSLAFTMDGKRLISTSQTGILSIWDANSGTKLLDENIHLQPTAESSERKTLAVLTGQDKLLITSGPDGLLKAFSLVTLREGGDGTPNVELNELWKIQAHDDAVSHLAVANHGEFIATGGVGGELKVWRFDSEDRKTAPRLHRRLTGHLHIVSAVAFTHDEKQLVSASGVGGKPDARLLVHDVETGDVVTELPQQVRVNALSFSHDGKILASAGWTGGRGVHFWDSASWQESNLIPEHTDAMENGLIYAISFSPDNSRLAEIGYPATVKIWDLTNHNLIPASRNSVSLKSFPFHFLSISPDGTTVASQGDGALRQWAVANGTNITRVRCPPGTTQLRFDPNNSHLISVNTNYVQVWSERDLSVTSEWKTTDYTSNIVAIDVSPDGKLIATGSYDASVRIWNRGGSHVREFAGHKERINTVNFSPNGHRLLTASQDCTVRVWDIEKGETLYAIDTEINAVAAFSPDGRQLAANNQGAVVVLYDATSGKEQRRLSGLSTSIRWIAFRPDGRQVAACASDGSLQVWDVASGRILHRFRYGPSTGGATQIAFTPDGRHLLAANNNSTIYVFRLHSPWPEAANLPDQTKQPTNPQTEIRLPKFEDPPPLNEWLKGREILTVKQDGTADYTTIQSALNALKPGQVVEVLDRGPYREVLRLQRDDPPTDIGLVTNAGTVIEIDKWSMEGSLAVGHAFKKLNGFRLSGFAFPFEHESQARCLRFDESSNIVIEDCAVYAAQNAAELDRQHEAIFLNLEKGTTYVRRCLIARSKLLAYNNPPKAEAKLLIEETLLVDGIGKSMLSVTGGYAHLLIRHNAIDGAGIAINPARHAKTRLSILNNTITKSGIFLHQEPGVPAITDGVVVANNISSTITFSGGTGGLGFVRERITHANRNWQINHNSCYRPPNLAVDYPLGKDDFPHAPSFLSNERFSIGYCRIPNDSPLATGGAGGDLSQYIGALPPGPAPQEGDWFTRLRERWRDVLYERQERQDD